MIIKRKIGPKGQIVLPKDVRDILGVHPGDQIIMDVNDDRVIIQPKIDAENFLTQFLSVPKKLDHKVDIEKLLDEEYE